MREDTGERVVALCGTGGYAEYATAPEALTFPIPDGVDDGTALALLHPGADRVAPVPHVARASARASRWSIVAAAGGVGSLAVQLGKPMGAGPRDRDGLDARPSATSRSSSAPTPRSTPTPRA